VALESYSEKVKFNLLKSKDNMRNTERKALKTLQEDPNINLKNADKQLSKTPKIEFSKDN